MRLPRDIAGTDLVKALESLGYEKTRQKGSHIRVTTMRNGQHHEVIPSHDPIKMGTLHNILRSLATHHNMTIEELLRHLDL